MERPSVKTRIASMLTMLGRFRPHLKRKQIYSLGMGILLLLAFIVGGIFMHSAYAASSGKQPTPGAGGGGGQKDVLIVTGVSGRTINGQHKDGSPVQVITTASTTFEKEGVSVSLSAVKAGDVIAVVGTSNGTGSITATHVEILVPGKHEKQGGSSAYGYITSIHGKTITIQDDNKTTTILTTDTTTFANKIEGKVVTLGSLKIGDFVYAEGKLNSDASLTAVVVVVAIPPDKVPYGNAVAGRITSIQGTTITIQEGKKTATIYTTATTEFVNKIVGGSTTLESLKVGDFVFANGKLNSDGSLTATAVVLANPPD